MPGTSLIQTSSPRTSWRTLKASRACIQSLESAEPLSALTAYITHSSGQQGSRYDRDHAYYHPNQEENVQLIFENPTDDQPILINYGPAFFESYHTLGNVPFIHGLNMNQNRSLEELQDAAEAACTSIGPQLSLVELGNEWNYAYTDYRPANYSELDYVKEWNLKSGAIQDAVQRACPGAFPGFMAPTFVLLDFFPKG